ncbi:hypothetical protein AB1Y20_009130 [Prymnesium parvum]|uniref:Alpha-glucosidase n=1 Tax=Prymnesium parvum TaxID=97485 RepID=A0AB34K0R0_PRYPA
MMALAAALAALAVTPASDAGEATSHARGSPSVIVDDVRVTAISPQLVRVEPRGPQGFEDRTTFMVASRDMSRALPLSTTSTPSGTLLSTSHYSVLLPAQPATGGAPRFLVLSPAGAVVYNASSAAPSLLHWPSPLANRTYALADFPRFYTPPWGAAPAPAGAAHAATNGYDFGNNVAGDTYVFLLGETLDEWRRARREFVALAGATPLLPDFAYGTWFTWWHGYTEAEAKEDIARWEAGALPLDVWALDMNWRNTSDGQDQYYDHPNTLLFPDFDEWFSFLKSQRLRTYFNDHPYPVASRGAGGLQTSVEEVRFRYAGLSEWMQRGLTYWWFDHNWAFSIPPPFVNTSRTSGVWDGLDNAAWGSHVYYSIVTQVDQQRKAANDTWYDRPMTLTKFGLPDWRPGMAYAGAAESPAHHRYPVWWTGDGVSLQASIESMVDAGVHGFKPYVHSDCGGDYRGSAGDLLRWTAHCVFGTILRFHGDDHRPWTYGPEVEASIKVYLEMRYKLIPSLLAAGQRATADGTPLVSRCDLLWPEYAEASSNLQYLWLDDTLVAPIYDSTSNLTSRDVWIPPGQWQDAWNGSVVTGPATLSVSQPYERVPMWHRADGGLVLALDQPALRVDEQEWGSVTLHAFPALRAEHTVSRTLYAHGSGAQTRVRMRTFGDGRRVHFEVDAAEDGAARGWLIRLQLPHESGARKPLLEWTASVDGKTMLPTHLAPYAKVATPFGSKGSPPAVSGSSILELVVPPRAGARVIKLNVGAMSVEA